MFAPVVSVETPDEHTPAILKLSSPQPALMLAMSSQLMAIIPEHVYGDGQDPKTHPQNSENVVGSGPFKLTLNSNQVSISSWKDLMTFL